MYLHFIISPCYFRLFPFSFKYYIIFDRAILLLLNSCSIKLQFFQKETNLQQLQYLFVFNYKPKISVPRKRVLYVYAFNPIKQNLYSILSPVVLICHYTLRIFKSFLIWFWVNNYFKAYTLMPELSLLTYLFSLNCLLCGLQLES